MMRVCLMCYERMKRFGTDFGRDASTVIFFNSLRFSKRKSIICNEKFLR